MKYWLAPSALLGVLSLAACSPPPAAESTPAPAYKPVATLQEIMKAVIDPNIDAIWNSVASISSAEGEEERRPQSDEDWQRLHQHALNVAEAGNLLLIESRPVAKAGVETSTGGAELSPQAIQDLIASQRGAFNANALALQDAAQLLIAAIEQKNVEELERAGGEVERACEQCHSQFWYPGDKRPE